MSIRGPLISLVHRLGDQVKRSESVDDEIITESEKLELEDTK